MDFSGLLSKEIDRKRKKAKSRNSLKKHKPQSPEPATEPAPLHDQPQPDNLLTISDAKLQESLQALDKGYKEDATKEEKLRTLEILVEQRHKDAKYQQYLEEENKTPETIDPEDVGRAEAPETFRRLCLQVRKFIKASLATWERNVDETFSEELLLETKRDLVKLMYKLRSGKLDRNMVITLTTIVHDIQTEQFIKASESYMKLSIGNVAWPIGVRDVGIHARSADKKIAGDNRDQLANIMHNEHTRRWIVATKRLINWWSHWHQQLVGAASGDARDAK